jgi:hypothetical protein
MYEVRAGIAMADVSIHACRSTNYSQAPAYRPSRGNSLRAALAPDSRRDGGSSRPNLGLFSWADVTA